MGPLPTIRALVHSPNNCTKRPPGVNRYDSQLLQDTYSKHQRGHVLNGPILVTPLSRTACNILLLLYVRSVCPIEHVNTFVFVWRSERIFNFVYANTPEAATGVGVCVCVCFPMCRIMHHHYHHRMLGQATWHFHLRTTEKWISCLRYRNR